MRIYKIAFLILILNLFYFIYIILSRQLFLKDHVSGNNISNKE